jgi:DNA-directed RNA polymerase specialized sigma24 family protein
MTPAESQPGQAQDKTLGPKRRTTQAQWTLTQQAFDKLLDGLSPDRDEAGKQYQSIRGRLIRFFESRLVDSAEDRADDTINRVARRIDEGKQIDNLIPYMYRTAYLVFLEALKEPEHSEIDFETTSAIAIEPTFDDSQQEQRQRCFDNCLNQLTLEQRELILRYYEETGRAKIELRKKLADTLSIPLNALRIRAHRIRMALEKCIMECLGSQGLSGNVTG